MNNDCGHHRNINVTGVSASERGYYSCVNELYQEVPDDTPHNKSKSVFKSDVLMEEFDCFSI